MADEIQVDTSLKGDQGTNEIDTSLPGENSLVGANPNPAATPPSPFADLQFDVTSPQDFSSATSGQQLNFSGLLNGDIKGLPGPGDTTVIPNGDGAPTIKGEGIRAQAMKYASQFLGTPYVWGGTSPSGFDCSGLVQYVTKRFGLNMPRLSQDQAGAGLRVPMSKLEAGDLVAFHEQNESGAGHIAFYLGDGYILEAPHTGAQVRIRRLGSGESYWGVHINYPGELDNGQGQRGMAGKPF